MLHLSIKATASRNLARALDSHRYFYTHMILWVDLGKNKYRFGENESFNFLWCGTGRGSATLVLPLKKNIPKAYRYFHASFLVNGSFVIKVILRYLLVCFQLFVVLLNSE